MENSSYGIRFLNPQLVINQLDIKKGIDVADFGCGSGYFSLAMAQKIGEEGTVYSFDVLPSCLEAVNGQAKNLSITNIITGQVNLEKENGSKLPDKSVDWVILKDMLFQNRYKKQILSEAKRVLKDNGKILVIEWKTSDTSIGPEKRLRIAKETLISMIQQEGMGVLKEVEAGDFHYGLVLIK